MHKNLEKGKKTIEDWEVDDDVEDDDHDDGDDHDDDDDDHAYQGR